MPPGKNRLGNLQVKVLDLAGTHLFDETKMVEYVRHDETVLAVLLHGNHSADGIEFFTPDDFSQQLGYMKRPKGYVIPPHVHNPVLREVWYTKEVLFIKSGRVRVDFYDDCQRYLESRILQQGDVILLAFGGHGFQMLEPSEMIEVKQGPYAGESDKTRFEPIPTDQIQTRVSSYDRYRLQHL